MFERRFTRLSLPLLLAALVLVPSCEPDECDLSMTYNVVGVGSYAVTWSDPSTTCMIEDFTTTGTSIHFERGGLTGLDISFTTPPAVGVHAVNVTYTDDGGKSWYSTAGGSGVPASGCIAAIASYEFVDWVRDDHHRIRGALSCPGPLVDTSLDLYLDDAAQLQISDATFNVYAGSFSF